MNEKICRFCLLTISNNNCRAVEESLLKFLKLNINISKENVMCIECADRLRVFSSFTSGCVYTGDEALPLSDLENGVKLEPESMETTSSSKSLMETKIKCSFCTKAHGREDLISLMESKDYKFLVNILQEYISETNLENTEELLTCGTCLGALQGGLSVILKCLRYAESERMDDKSQIELKEVQQFTLRPILKLKNEPIGVNELEGRYDKIKEEYTVMAEAEIKYEKGIGDTELIINTEDDIKSEQSECDGCSVATKLRVRQKYLTLKGGPLKTTDKHKYQHARKVRDLIRQNASEGTIFRCDSCSFQTKHKKSLRSHMITHESSAESTMYQCSLCSHQTKHKGNLRKHMVTHKNSSEVTMYQCDTCDFNTKYKQSLGVHMSMHKDPSEIAMYQCDCCSFQTKHKSNIQNHRLTHKLASETTMHQCDSCDYKTKYKPNLGRHLLTHKDHSEITLYQCSFCSHQTKHKRNLYKHIATHKNSSELTMYQCDFCDFKTKHKQSWHGHTLTHRNPSEITMYQCEICSFRTKYKASLQNHMVTHESLSNITMYRCGFCPHQTKHKRNLHKHVVTHKHASANNGLKSNINKCYV